MNWGFTDKPQLVTLGRVAISGTSLRSAAQWVFLVKLASETRPGLAVNHGFLWTFTYRPVIDTGTRVFLAYLG